MSEKKELLQEATELNIPYRTTMTLDELRRAVRQAKHKEKKDLQTEVYEDLKGLMPKLEELADLYYKRNVFASFRRVVVTPFQIILNRFKDYV